MTHARRPCVLFQSPKSTPPLIQLRTVSVTSSMPVARRRRSSIWHTSRPRRASLVSCLLPMKGLVLSSHRRHRCDVSAYDARASAEQWNATRPKRNACKRDSTKSECDIGEDRNGSRQWAIECWRRSTEFKVRRQRTSLPAKLGCEYIVALVAFIGRRPPRRKSRRCVPARIIRTCIGIELVRAQS